MRPLPKTVAVDELHLSDHQRIVLTKLLRAVTGRADAEDLARSVETGEPVSMPKRGDRPYGPAGAVTVGQIADRIDDELASALGAAQEAIGEAYILIDSVLKRDVWGARMRAHGLATRSDTISKHVARADVLRDQLYPTQAEAEEHEAMHDETGG